MSSFDASTEDERTDPCQRHEHGAELSTEAPQPAQPKGGRGPHEGQHLGGQPPVVDLRQEPYQGLGRKVQDDPPPVARQVLGTTDDHALAPTLCDVGTDDRIDSDCSPITFTLPDDNHRTLKFDFGFTVPDGLQDGPLICSEVLFGIGGRNAVFDTVSRRQIFCIQTGVTGTRLLSKKETHELWLSKARALRRNR